LSKPILFISTMAGSEWGGSEELWTRTVTLLAKQGVAVAASVHGWPVLHQRIAELSRAGIDLRPRLTKSSFVNQVRRYLSGKTKMVMDIEQTFGDAEPSLVVISNGSVLPPIELVELCLAKNWPFATLAHSNHSGWWPSDELANRWRRLLPFARRCFFVSRAIRDLAQRQLGYDFDNAEVVFNPVVVKISSPLPLPPQAPEQELRMATVGLLFPTEKGQDILFDVLAKPHWHERNWRLTLYGNGPNRDILERLAVRLKLEDRIFFAGHVSPEEIWRENHVLVMPSRYEGGPMTTVEAMWCGRVVVATDVGLNRDVIDDGVTGFLADTPGIAALNDALERMWIKRDKLEDIGTLAAVSIRKLMPHDPVELFAAKLKDLVNIG
jgi:glycosyltransferase involved in cell wall biosynthesis